MSESQTVVMQLSKAPKAIKHAVRQEALKEAFDNLLADTKLRLLSRKQIRALAKTQVNRLFAEQRRLQKEEEFEAVDEVSSTAGPTTNAESKPLELTEHQKQIVRDALPVSEVA